MTPYEVLVRQSGVWVVEESGLDRFLARAEAKRLGGFCQPVEVAERFEPVFDEEMATVPVGPTVPQAMWMASCGHAV